MENKQLPSILVVGTGPMRHVGKEVFERLKGIENIGTPVLLVDDDAMNKRISKKLMDELRRETLDIDFDDSPDPCEKPEDTSRRAPNNPWYNSMRPGGSNNKRGKRARSGKHW